MGNDVEIPDKANLKIGEVAKLLELEPYVLRYWETEFEQLHPDKTRSGQRVYKRADIEQIVHIRELLYTEQYTIAGARRQLELHPDAPVSGAAVDPARLTELEEANASLQQTCAQLRAELEEVEDARATLRAKLEQLEQERDVFHAQVETLEQQLARTSDRLEQKVSELAQIEAAEASRTAIDERWETMADQLNEDVVRLEREIEEYRQEIAQLITQRDQLEGRCEEYEAKLRHQKQGKHRVLELLHSELVGLHQLAHAR